MVTISAPGKCIIIGEHAAVYGKPAILGAIGLRTFVCAEESREVKYHDKRFDTEALSFDLEEVEKTTHDTKNIWQECNEKKNFSELFKFIKQNRYSNYRKAAVGIALEKLKIENGVSVTIEGDLPVGSGLGSSASLSVALPKAFSVLYGKGTETEKINQIAFELEKIIHGTPSGGDNSACCYGGLIWFKKAKPKNEIISLKKEVPYSLGNFLIVYSGDTNRPTGELVQQVRDLDEHLRDKTMEKIENLTNKFLGALKNKNYNKIKEIINETQRNLSDLTISTKDIDKICSSVVEIGGAAKLSGAGGGGTVLCYHRNKEKLKGVVDSLGYKYWDTELAAEGIREEI